MTPRSARGKGEKFRKWMSALKLAAKLLYDVHPNEVHTNRQERRDSQRLTEAQSAFSLPPSMLSPFIIPLRSLMRIHFLGNNGIGCFSPGEDFPGDKSLISCSKQDFCISAHKIFNECESSPQDKDEKHGIRN